MSTGIQRVRSRLAGSIVALLLATLLAALPAVHSLAQTAEGPIDYEVWERTAARAEAAIETGRASSEALDRLRQELVRWRAQFLEGESANATRIATLRNQLDALGPAPEEAGTEPSEIAQRREELAAQLARLEAPQLAATEAYNRADGLIGELDAVIRARQADLLLELGPTPLNPAIWPEAATFTTRMANSVLREFERAWSSPAQRAMARQSLPVTVLLVLIGVVLFIRGRRWMELATESVQRRSSEIGRLALSFLVSLGQVALPVAGLHALVMAALSTGLVGLRGEELIRTLPAMGFFAFGSLWLGARVFGPGPMTPGLLDLTDAARAQARRYLLLLGVLIAIAVFLTVVFDFDRSAETAIAVLSFPLLLAMGLVLFRLGRFLTRAVAREGSESDEQGFRHQLVRLLGRAVMAVGVLGPVAAAIGYANLSAAVVFPTALTLALIATLAAIHGPIRDLYALITRRPAEEAGEALVPILVSFCVAIASTPLLALIWGVRPAEMAEVWARFVAGVEIGETRISPGDVLTVLVVFALGYALTRLIQGALRTTVLPKTRMDIGGQNAIVSGLGYVGIFLAALLAITAAGINLSNLAIFASALAVGVGFGMQNIVSNFVSGIILLIERPISEGDWIEVGGQMGYVRDISVRSTRIETFDRTDVIVPNADLVSGTVINYTRGNLIGRVIVPVGVAYGTDTRKVEAILREIAEAHPMVVIAPPPSVIFMGFGADSLDFEIRAILRDVNWVLSVKSDMNHEIARRFAEEGIEIPFAQRDVWLRNPEVLRAGDRAALKDPEGSESEETNP